MARSTRPPKIGTLRSVIDHHQALWLHCESCGRSARLDPLALAVAHGENLPLQRLLQRARCSVCGGRDVELQVPPDVGPGGRLKGD